jgi:hypothetical protein
MIPPTAGPPIGVEPWSATNQRAITRPRIEGSEASWSVVLPIDMNDTLAAPTRARATSSIAMLGAAAARAIVTAKAAAAMVTGRSPVRPRAATTRPPAIAPAPIAAVMKP